MWGQVVTGGEGESGVKIFLDKLLGEIVPGLLWGETWGVESL